jgi:hypothetical protein
MLARREKVPGIGIVTTAIGRIRDFQEHSRMYPVIFSRLEPRSRVMGASGYEDANWAW